MTIDISRKTFDPRRNTAWTTTMQGRVATDAPLNEDKRVRDRRLRAETVDLIGRCGYPSALSDSFKISLSENGELMIGTGRYYVDGHLAENFGTKTGTFDDVLAEMRDPDPLPFAKQPRFVGDNIPPVPSDGRYLVYLDVWQRDVTFLEDETILDPAVPADTFARRQTVWQVKTFGPLPKEVTCETPDADIKLKRDHPLDVVPFANAIARSNARLTTQANPAGAVTNPCLLPPGAEYRGTDNRTYSYVIHDIAADGTPLVKFSRVHGVVATTILSQPKPNTLEVVEVAKDDFLRFNAGDWVEVTDKERFLSGKPGVGVMARVLKVDDSSSTITLEGPLLPNDWLRLKDNAGPDVDKRFQPIIRRWDQSGQVCDENGGLIPVPTDGTFVALEDGVEAALSLADGGAARIGDSWTFIARNDGSVEELDAVPPEDFHHHYCRLAVVEAEENRFVSVVSDCRSPIPRGCCTVVVSPGQSIQKAIDSLSPINGGCICLKPGVHEPRDTLKIEKPNITLHGESHGVIVRRPGPGPVLQVADTSRIDLHTIRFEHLANKSGEGALQISNSESVVVQTCEFVGESEDESRGVRISRGIDVTIRDNIFNQLDIGVSMSGRNRIRIEGNSLSLGGGDEPPGRFGIKTEERTEGPISVVGNRISGALNGIRINDDSTGRAPMSQAEGSLVAENDIELSGKEAAPADLDIFCGIDTASPDTTIRGNHVTFAGSARAAIRANGVGVKVTGNTVEADSDASVLNFGIFIGNTALPDDKSPTGQLTGRVVVSENTVRGVTMGIAARETHSLLISGNDLEPVGTVVFLPAIALLAANDTRVTNNSIRGAIKPDEPTSGGIVAIDGSYLRISGNTIAHTGFGIAVGREWAPTVSNNSITGARLFGAIALWTFAQTSFVQNHVSLAGWLPGNALPIGIGALVVLGELRVEANEIFDTGLGSETRSVAYGIAGVGVLEARIDSNLVTYSPGGLRELAERPEHRALLLQGVEIDDPNDPNDPKRKMDFLCQITNNKFIGKGQSALIEMRDTRGDNRLEHVFFNHNYCNHIGRPEEHPKNATVILKGHSCVVMGNQIKADNPRFNSVNVDGKKITVVGNITSGSISPDPSVQKPADAFNLKP